MLNETEVRYIIELTSKQWLEHWNMLWIGSTMADYLKLLPTLPAGKDKLIYSSLAAELAAIYDTNREYARQLAGRWFSVATPLGIVYEKAAKRVVEHSA